MRTNKTLLAAIPIVILLAGWEISSRAEWINNALFPPPSAIVSELVVLAQEGLPTRSTLFTHMGYTLMRVLSAVTAGTLLGVLLGAAMGLSSRVYRFFNPLIMLLMPIPGIAMAPLFIVWFGFGEKTIISLAVLSAFFPIVYTTVAGVRSVDMQLVRAARLMGSSRVGVVTAVHLPWAAAYVFNGLKVGMARCWMTVIAVEFVAASNWGLGYMIWSASEYLRSDIVYGGIFLLIITYFVLEKGLVNTLEKRTIARWGMIRQD